jgi:hypothetical protein
MWELRANSALDSQTKREASDSLPSRPKHALDVAYITLLVGVECFFHGHVATDCGGFNFRVCCGARKTNPKAHIIRG